MRHIIFLVMVLADSVGLVSIILLALSYFRYRNRKTFYALIYLMIGLIQLIFLTYLEYRYVNLPNWHLNYCHYTVLNCILQGMSIFILPLLVNEVFNISARKKVIMMFFVLFLIAMLFVLVPYFLGIMRNGTPISGLWSYRTYMAIFATPFIYMILMAKQHIREIAELHERRFLLFTAGVLLVIGSQIVFPVFKTFPEVVAILAACYLFWNILFILYTYLNLARLSDRDSSGNKPLTEWADQMKLTGREKEILEFLLEGHTNQEIGERLFISLATVKAHIQSIYRKCGVRNRIQLFNLLRTTDKSEKII